MSYTGGPQVVNFRPSGDQSWVQWSQCTAPGTPEMFPADGDTKGINEAKAVCKVCPVRAECLAEALKRSESFGVWGGLTTDERRAADRKAARKWRKSGGSRQTPDEMANSLLDGAA